MLQLLWHSLLMLADFMMLAESPIYGERGHEIELLLISQNSSHHLCLGSEPSYPHSKIEIQKTIH
jgi:hypothetical protein